ncbi:MAG: hypothetical protein ACUVTD_04645 [Nitrososphaerales archaeon]
MVIALLLAPFSFSYQAEAKVTIERISSFNHQMFVSDYGFILVNETIFIKNDFKNSAILPPINITYPPEIYDKIIPQVISPNGFSFNIALTENYTRLTIDPPQSYEIQPNETITISIKFYLVKIFSFAGGLNYSASIPLVPALSLPVDQVSSSLSIPPFIIFASQHENLTSSIINNRWTLMGAFSNVSQSFSITERVEINTISESVYFALLEFTEAKRELILSSLGDIRVRDTITMISYDDRSVSKLKPSLLTDDFKNVIIIPPLANPFPNPLSEFPGQKLTEVALGTSLKEGEIYTVTLEYTIKSLDFIKAKDGLFELSLPSRTPIDGVVYDYTVKATFPEGFFAYSKTEESKVNASPLDSEQKIEFRIGLAWASKEIMPVASFIFIATLIAFLIVGKPVIKEELKEIVIRTREYIESFEEKITATKELIDLYKKRQSDRISKGEFKMAQRLLEERRSKASIKINELRQKLVSLQPSLQEPLSRIGDLHRDYDRVVRELTNLYEQFFAKKVRAEAFDRHLPIHQRRVDEARNSLLDGIDMLRREVEELD